mgnify:CR=1 FL=1
MHLGSLAVRSALVFSSVTLLGARPPFVYANCTTPRVWTVCATDADFSSIGAAMNSIQVAPCDTILVCDGTFQVSAQILFKSGVILRSATGPDHTTIEWTGSSHGRIMFVNGAAIGSKIGIESATSGFTFKGGDPAAGEDGGAIRVTNSNLIIQHCAFDSNQVTDGRGGAIFADPGSTKSFSIENCSFTGNRAIHADTLNNRVYAGAVYLANCDDAKIDDCTFDNNHADCGAVNPANCSVQGSTPNAVAGAVMVSACRDFVMTDCTFDRNSSFDAGAFNYWAPGQPPRVPLLIKDNTFLGNRAARNGGAVGFDHGNWGIRNCEFVENTADSAAGAVFVLDTTGFLRDCSFSKDKVLGSGNAGHFNGGGAVGLHAVGGNAEADTFDIEGCRFDSCSSAAGGGSIYLDQAYEFIIRKSIFNGSHADGNGGGVYVANGAPCDSCTDDTVFVAACAFTACDADGDGGALFINAGNVILDDLLIAGGSADEGGGVYYRENQIDPMIWTNLTFAGNSGSGAALFLNENLDLAVERSIFFSNDGGSDSIVELGTPATVDTTFLCCDSYGNDPGNAILPCSSCFSADPLFCDADNNDYMLPLGSPCRAGNHPNGANCGEIGIRAFCEYVSSLHTWLDEVNPTANYNQDDTLRVGAAGDTAVGLPAFSDVALIPFASVDSAMITAAVYRVGGSGVDSVTVHNCLQPAILNQACWNVFRLGAGWDYYGAGKPDGDYDADTLGVGSSFETWTGDTLALSPALGRWVEDEVIGNYPYGRGVLVIRPRGTKDVVFYDLILRIWSKIK